MRTPEMRLRSIKEENGQGLYQPRPLRLEAVYGLVIGEASPPLTVEIDKPGECYRAHSSGTQSSTAYVQ